MKKIILIFLFIVVIIFGFFLVSYCLIQKPIFLSQTITININQGDGIDKISQSLKKAGLIRSQILFKIYLVLTNNSQKVQFGTYLFSDKINIPEMVEILSEGKNQENKITIPEGMRISEIGLYLEAKGVVSADDFIKETQNPGYRQKYWFLKNLPKAADLEGYLFPDTYFFKPKATAVEIIFKMLENFDQKITNNLAQEVKKQNRKFENIIILASIVEKEVPQKSARAKVAGVYYNRLQKKMKLEADPTVQYAKETENPSKKYQNFWQKITTRDYQKILSPFNTYLNFGLPPGPISNPGLDSIKAVIFFESNNYLYFFNTPSGKTIYSTTGEEHEQNKLKYLK